MVHPATTHLATSTAGGGIVEIIDIDDPVQPDTVEVAAGTTARWENRGCNDHNVLSTDSTGVSDR